MGRIGEALRRSGAGRPRNAPSSSPQDQERTFASPWTFGEQERPSKRPEPASERVRTPEPAPAFDKATPQRPITRQTVTDRFRSEWKMRLSVGQDADPRLSEQFRRLAATLIHGQRTNQLKSLLITSAVPEEGKTLTSVNLALILSESYRRRVLLIDADLRRPAISGLANLDIADGLSESLNASDERKVSLIQLSETLSLLPAGRAQKDPLSAISSPRMNRLVEEAAAEFDWVIVDTPPLSAAADAGLLAQLVDGVLMVIRADRTPQNLIDHAITAIGRERILGVILNGVEGTETTPYSGYYGYGATADTGATTE
jgi:protein-tyrosine kinase